MSILKGAVAAQWRGQRRRSLATVGLWAEDASGWWVLDPAGEALAEDANGFLVPGSAAEAVTLIRTVQAADETLFFTS